MKLLIVLFSQHHQYHAFCYLATYCQQSDIKRLQSLFLLFFFIYCCPAVVLYEVLKWKGGLSCISNLCTLPLKEDYPKYRHPAWNMGSIGYRADDGNIFIGSGVGDLFVPRCHIGDRMGFGILFRRGYMCWYDSYVSTVQTAVYDLLITSRIVCPVLCAS